MFEYGSGVFLAFLLGIIDLTLILIELASIRASNFSKINFLFDLQLNTYVEKSQKRNSNIPWYIIKKLIVFPLLSWIWVAIYIALYIHEKRILSIVPEPMKAHLYKISTFHLTTEEMEYIYKKDVEEYKQDMQDKSFYATAQEHQGFHSFRDKEYQNSFAYSSKEDNKYNSFLKKYFMFCGWTAMIITGPVLIILTLLSTGDDLPAIWTIPLGVVATFWGYSIVFGIRKNKANLFLNAITIMWIALFISLIQLISDPILLSFIRFFISILQMIGIYMLKKKLFPKLL